MIMQPGLITHPKYLLLEREVGNEALKYLFRLFAHCQENQRGEDWGEVGPDYVEMVCEWRGERRKLFLALKRSVVPGRCGFVEIRDKRVIIHDWNEHNKQLIQRWNANPEGRRGKKNERQPTDNRPIQEVAFQTTGRGSDRRGVDRIGVDRSGGVRAPDSAEWGMGMVNCPPSEAEVVDYGAKLDPPAPADVCRRFFNHFQGSHWGSQTKNPICDFRPRLVNWWENDLSAREKKTPKETGKTLMQLRADLQIEPDSKRKMELMDKIEKMEAAS
jgi:hypothetical protein